MESNQQEIKKKKGGRPPKDPSTKRKNLQSIWLTDAEAKLLKEMMEQTGKDAAELFRHSLFEKGLKIPKTRLAPPELMELLTDFKRKSSLLQYFSNKDREFTQEERLLLIGSSHSLRVAIERFQRSVFLSLDKSDQLEQLDEALSEITRLRDELKGKDKPMKSDFRELDNWLAKANKILIDQYRYLITPAAPLPIDTFPTMTFLSICIDQSEFYLPLPASYLIP